MERGAPAKVFPFLLYRCSGSAFFSRHSMNRRGLRLVLACLIRTNNALRRAQSKFTKPLTIHSRSAPVFLSNARGATPFDPYQQKGFNRLLSSLCAKKVLIPVPLGRRSSFFFMMFQKIAGGDFMKKQILRGNTNHSKLLRGESHREAVAFFSEDSFVFKFF